MSLLHVLLFVLNYVDPPLLLFLLALVHQVRVIDDGLSLESISALHGIIIQFILAPKVVIVVVLSTVVDHQILVRLGACPASVCVD